MSPSSALAGSNSSLEYYLCMAGDQLQSGTTLQLLPGIHRLDSGKFCRIRNLANLTIRGQTSPRTESTVIRCNPAALGRGIAFVNMSSLHIEGVTIANCGMEIPSELSAVLNNTFFYLGPLQKAVLLFSHCTNMVIECVSIEHCYGFALLAVNPLGDVMMRNVSISDTDNMAHPNCSGRFPSLDMSCSGSGAVFIFADTDTTHSLLNQSESNRSLITLSIVGCSFNGNKNFIPPHFFDSIFYLAQIALNTQPFLLPGAGGLALIVGQLEYFVDILVADCIVQNNTADFGALFIVYINSLCSSRVHIHSTTIADNDAGQLHRGGGILIGLITFADFLASFPNPDKVFEIAEISSSTIHSNTAPVGGGLYCFLAPQNVLPLSFVIRDTIFSQNVATYGSALEIAQIRSTFHSKEVHVLLEDVVAWGNTYSKDFTLIKSPEGTSAFTFTQTHNITIVGTQGKGSYFHNNPVTVIEVYGANVFLLGNISFENNYGFDGGALKVSENSLLFFNEGSKLKFESNTATRYGGAIYIDTSASSAGSACALQVLGSSNIKLKKSDLEHFNLKITFSNNRAGTAGNSVFGNPIYHCSFIPGAAIDHGSLVTNNQNLLYNAIFEFPSVVNNSLAEVVSKPFRVCTCQNETFTPDDCLSDVPTLQHIVPGKMFQVYLTPIDIMGTPVPSSVYSELKSTAEYTCALQLGHNQDLQQLPGYVNCQPVDYVIFAPENSLVRLEIFAYAGGLRLPLLINMTRCPPGFTVSKTEDECNQCVCSVFVTSDIQSFCDVERYTVKRPGNSWVGTIQKNGTLQLAYAPMCPNNYCNDKVIDIDLSIPDQLCMSGHTGILCGACKDDLSSIFGSANCKKCTNSWLATILIFAVLGPLLVILLFLLNLTVAQGTINGLIFYANVVSVNANIFFRESNQGFLFIFFSLLNLDLGFPLCFYNGMSELAKVGLQYIFPVYILLIGIVITALSQYSKVMQTILAQQSGLHVLSTMFYLSYSKILRCTIDTFTNIDLYVEGAKKSSIWFHDGNVNISSHEFRFVVALACLVFVGFVTPYVITFTFSNLISQWVTSTRFTAVMDANLAPFKYKLRFWFGVRLILLLILYSVYATLGTKSADLALTFQVCFLVLLTTIQAFIRPFKRSILELLDIFFIVNLILLMLANEHTRRNTHDQEKIVISFLSIAFTVSCGIFGYHIEKTLCKIPAIAKYEEGLKKKIKCKYAAFKECFSSKKKPQEAPEVLHCTKTMSVRDPVIVYTTANLTVRNMEPAPDDNSGGSRFRESILSNIEHEERSRAHT